MPGFLNGDYYRTDHEDGFWDGAFEVFVQEQRREAVAQSRRKRLLTADHEPRIHAEYDDESAKQ
jgi:hypothetical protein